MHAEIDHALKYVICIAIFMVRNYLKYSCTKVPDHRELGFVIDL